MTDMETQPGDTPDLTPAVAGITDGTICIKIERGRFGVKRKASTDQVTVASDKSLLALSKTILESPELKLVHQLDHKITTFLQARCLKSMFRGGIYLIPLGLVEEVDAALTQFKAEREALVEAAVATYDERIAETSSRLRVLHEPGDYPSRSRFATAFYLDWQFITFETPTKLRAIKASLFENERQKAAAKLSAVADECRDALRVGLADMVAHMVDRLTPDEDGRPKRFLKSTVENFTEFFRTFEMKNVTNDIELAAVVDQAKAVLHGVDAETLRKDEALRAAIQGQLAQLKAQLVPMVVERNQRQFVLDAADAAQEVA